MRLAPEKRNKLCQWIATKGTSDIFDTLKELGFNDVDDLVSYLENRT